MTFLANILREEGGFEYKKAIVESILEIVGQIPESKEAGMCIRRCPPNRGNGPILCDIFPFLFAVSQAYFP